MFLAQVTHVHQGITVPQDRQRKFPVMDHAINQNLRRTIVYHALQVVSIEAYQIWGIHKLYCNNTSYTVTILYDRDLNNSAIEFAVVYKV